MAVNKYALITGCSEGGLGFFIAKEFQARGVHVFATARTLAKMSALENLSHVTLLPLDVTSQDSIDVAVAAVSKATGGKLDYLVNNAGSQYVMPMLDLDLDMAKKMFNVNVWGVVAVSKSFGPLVIAAKGSIANLASIAGPMCPPFMGLYAGSKSACETISETFRRELKPFGVRVVTVITGAIETKLFTNSPKYRLPEGSLYSPAAKQFDARAAGTDHADRLGKPDVFARSLVGDIMSGASGRVSHGNLSSIIPFITTFLPAFIVDRIAFQGVGLDLIHWG